MCYLLVDDTMFDHLVQQSMMDIMGSFELAARSYDALLLCWMRLWAIACLDTPGVSLVGLKGYPGVHRRHAKLHDQIHTAYEHSDCPCLTRRVSLLLHRRSKEGIENASEIKDLVNQLTLCHQVTNLLMQLLVLLFQLVRCTGVLL